jgi:O6-methylguanine-DNA--protein-cysteine methyltransferase
MTYKQVAAEVGKPKAARAVGQVMSQNKLPLFVPVTALLGLKIKWAGAVQLA